MDKQISYMISTGVHLILHLVHPNYPNTVFYMLFFSKSSIYNVYK